MKKNLDLFDKMLADAVKEDCELFIKTENGETSAGIRGHDLPLLLNAIGLIQQLLEQTHTDKEIFDYLYEKTKTRQYGKRDWK